MKPTQNLFSAKLGLVMFVAILLLAGSILAAGQTESVIYGFKHPSDGSNPASGLISDSAGNFYGTTCHGGTAGNGGTVFQLAQQGGHWTKTVLYSFTGGSDGGSPLGSLILDEADNLYGIASSGGSSTCGDGCGTVFKLSRQGSTWVFTLIYSFQGGTTNGQTPAGRLAFDKGNLYGATIYGGNSSCQDGCGTVFQLTPSEGGGWTEAVIHFFGRTHDGANPAAGLIVDDKGNLFGTTQYGGSAGQGTVFKLDAPATRGNTWAEHVLYNFQGMQDGSGPRAALIFDREGNLDGTTVGGGSSGGGTVFQLVRGQDGDWTENVLYNFCSASKCADGADPIAGLIFDGPANLYGTTYGGGSGGLGTVFELTPPASEGGAWTETVLWSFTNGKDGFQPEAGLLRGKFGVLYGTTFYGGNEGANCTYKRGCGTVFKVKP